MRNKTCNKCGEKKPLSEFYRYRDNRKNAIYYRSLCKVCFRQQADAYQKTEAGRRTQQRAKIKYNTMHREKILEYGAEYRSNNRELCRTAARNWAQNNPEKRREHCAKRRARTRGANVENVDYNEIIIRDNCICQICKEPVDLGLEYPDPLSKSFDHILPLSRGGPHTFENIQLTHLTCNFKKWANIQ